MEEIRRRITDLEIRSTYQERLIEELGDQLAECHRRIAKLETDNRRLGESVTRAMAGETPLSPDE